MTPEMLDVLRLRRQAAQFGWRLAAVDGGHTNRRLRYERVHADGVHTAWVSPGHVPGVGESWDAYRSTVVESTAGDGYLKIAHVGERQAVAIIRAYFGWPS